jgi:hypothetical protein
MAKTLERERQALEEDQRRLEERRRKLEEKSASSDRDDREIRTAEA